MIALLDYGAGNVGSVLKAIEYLGCPAAIADSAEALAGAQKLVFPGQGHFGAVMNALAARRLLAPLQEFIKAGKPLLGICIGLQVLYEASDEAPEALGLGILPGRVRRFEGVFKVPHVGWSQLELRNASRLFQGVANNCFVYFCHSYYAPVTNESAAVTDYGQTFAAGVETKNLWAVQFHPEKSGEVGLRILRNFLEL